MSDRLQERSWNAGSSFAGRVRDEACFTPTCLTKPEKQAMKQLLLVILLLSGVSAIKEGCRQVEVEETRVCHEREVEECGVCATIHVRECTIQMEVAWVPVRVKRCVEGQQSAGCTRGGRQLCRTHYRTSCGTRMEYHDMEEDYPKCRRERVNTCTKEEQQEEEKDGKRCREVEAMRCSIEKRTVRKAKPVSSCRRIPTKMCAKKKCKKVKRQRSKKHNINGGPKTRRCLASATRR